MADHRTPTPVHPDYGGRGWVGGLIVLFIIVAVLAWGWGDRRGGNGTNSTVGGPAPHAVTRRISTGGTG